MYQNQFSRNIFTARRASDQDKVDRLVFGITMFLGTAALILLPWGQA